MTVPQLSLVDLLSHRSGLACNDLEAASPGNETKLYETADWAKAFVDLPLATDSGTVGRYCSGGIIAAGRIVERATGKPLPDFVQEALFRKLGISRANWRWNFILNRSQRNEFGQIYLRPRGQNATVSAGGRGFAMMLECRGACPAALWTVISFALRSRRIAGR